MDTNEIELEAKKNDSRFFLTAGKKYKVQLNNISHDMETLFIWVTNDNKRQVNVKLSRFKIE